LEHKLEHLKRNHDPKKWWDTVKQIAGYPKKKYFSSLVLGDQVVSGKQLAEKINEAFVSVNRDIPPLSPIPSPDTQSQSDYTTIATEYITKEENIYYKLSSISSSKAAGQIKYRIMRLCAPAGSSCYFNLQRLPSTGVCSRGMEKSRRHPCP
jgi:hypothetical protein